jgi:uncharacterized damage-inducible protein DinB
MKSIIIIILFISIMANQSIAQEQPLPYHQIPDYPGEYNANNVAARLLDGLGYRYYWVTKDLREADMDYRPSEDSRTTRQTLDHIYGLSRTIVNAPQSKVNTAVNDELSLEQLRRRTLENIALASKLMKEDKDGSMDNYKILFKRGEDTIEYPFWNMINGPIADAIYHTGQVVAFRRASGNPIQKGVRMLTGKTAE